MSGEALAIQAKALELVEAAMSPQFKRFMKTPLLTVNSKDLPLFGCYIAREERTADGDANHGPPHFVHRLTLQFNGAVSIPTEDNGDNMVNLEAWMTQIDDLLLRNPAFVNLSEGVLSMRREAQYSRMGETTLGEIRVEMVLSFRTIFEPVITDTLDTIHVKTQYPTPERAGPDDNPQTQQVTVEYDLAQS